MQKQKKYWIKIYLSVLAVFFLVLANAQTVFGQWNKSNYDSTQLPHGVNLTQLITNIAKWLLMIFGFIAVIGFVISGLIYLLSAGDEDAQERAKRAMVYSITGVIVGLSGLVILYAVQQLLGGQTTF